MLKQKVEASQQGAALLKRMDDDTPCRICIELSRFLVAARQPRPPNLFLGLSEAGKRNHIRQHEEKILKAEFALKKHESKCTTAPDKS